MLKIVQKFNEMKGAFESYVTSSTSYYNFRNGFFLKFNF